MTRLNLNKIAAAAIREHLAGVIAPTMDTCIDVHIEINLRCTVCGGEMGVNNPRGAGELRCWWCHKEAKKGVMVR
jgi:hypothetical protein